MIDCVDRKGEQADGSRRGKGDYATANVAPPNTHVKLGAWEGKKQSPGWIWMTSESVPQVREIR